MQRWDVWTFPYDAAGPSDIMKAMKRLVLQRWLGYLGPLIGVTAVAACFKLLITTVNATTVALSFLLVVLLTAYRH